LRSRVEIETFSTEGKPENPGPTERLRPRGMTAERNTGIREKVAMV
jgi:hypothetical protein